MQITTILPILFFAFLWKMNVPLSGCGVRLLILDDDRPEYQPGSLCLSRTKSSVIADDFEST